MIKLIYFAIRGRVEPARLMLEMTSTPYEFQGLTLDDWRGPQGKALMLERTPFGQVPVLEDDGIVLGQSQAIYRYVARKHGLAGDSLAEQARVDEVAETATELLTDIVQIYWNKDIDALRPSHLEKTRDRLRLLSRYFKRVRGDAKHWALPGRYTLADVIMAYSLESILPLHPGLLEEFPELHDYMAGFFASKGVSEYVRSDRRPRIWTAPIAPFGGTPEQTHHWTAG